mmetsp:Transcript_36801/g.85623  ORF Transcript_36801/g.85623 Transcript_36801/m.85623 type:complete len:403 (+) Transcript_36801:57-1265(+)
MAHCGSSASSSDDGNSQADEQPYRTYRGVADREVPPTSLPDDVEIRVNRKMFESCLQGRSFQSWQQFVLEVGEVSPEQVVQGSQGSIVKLDPLQVFAWVSTVMMEICIWGLVVWAACTNLTAGFLLTVLYGGMLYLVAACHCAPQLAGMIWPNVPCAVAAAGAICCLIFSDWEHASIGTGAGLMLLFSILPQTLVTVVFLLGLRGDPDRASLVSNLFLGVWASIEALYVMAVGDKQSSSDKWSESWLSWHYFSWSCCLILGLITIGVAWLLSANPSRWASPHVTSWTLNVGCLASFVSLGLLLSIPVSERAMNWVLFFLASPTLGLLGRHLDRSFPVLLSAVALLIVSIRACVEVGIQTDNALSGFAAFGLLGLVVAVCAQCVCGKRPGGAALLDGRKGLGW